jgi:hypothetical protein
VDREIEQCYWRRQAYVRKNQPAPQELLDKVKALVARRNQIVRSGVPPQLPTSTALK